MTVTITQDIRDIGALPDNVTVRFGSPVPRQSGSSLITTKWKNFTAVNGILTAAVEPGPAKVMIRHVGTFDITIPNTDSGLWALIAAGVAFPPGTSADAVAAAVSAYLENNPIDSEVVNVAVDALIAGAPGALDTLNELAAALGDDANFAATTATALADKVAKSTVTTKGDLIVGTGSATVARQGVGANEESLIADSTQSAGVKWVRRQPAGITPVRNTVAAIGDSTTAWGSDPYGANTAENYLTHLCIESDQRMRFAGAFATTGYTLSQIQSTHLPSVLAMNPLPGACVVFGGINDAATTFSTLQTTLRAVTASLSAVGVVPILVTLPPRSDSAPNAARTIKWNTWLMRYAALNGFSVIDAYTALVGVDGACRTEYRYDTIHPNNAGHRAVALRALADGLPQMFPPTSAGLTSRSTADLSNLFNNGTSSYGLFTVDTNADGIADGLSASGTGTFGHAVVTPNPADALQGNWQEMSRTTADNASDAFGAILYSTTISAGWSVGDVVAFSARVQTENIITTGTPWNLRIQCLGAASDQSQQGPSFWQADVDGLVYIEFAVPAGTTALFMQAAMQIVTSAGTAKLRFGEITLRNLTTGGTL